MHIFDVLTVRAMDGDGGGLHQFYLPILIIEGYSSFPRIFLINRLSLTHLAGVGQNIVNRAVIDL